MSARLIRSAVALVATAALAMTGAGAAQAALHWSGLKLIDRAQPFGDPAMVNGVSCPTASFCLAIGSQGTVVTATGSGAPKVIRNGVDTFANLRDVSCPTASLCFAIEGTAVLWTRNPGAAKPIFSKVSLKVPLGSFISIDCPTASLCVAPANNGTVWTSTRPTGPASAWKATATLGSASQFLHAVGCAPGGGLCVASLGGYGGANPQLATTTNPSAAAAAWTITPAPSTGPVTAISCPSTALCVAISSSEVLSSANPVAGGSSWIATPEVDPLQTALTGIDCGAASPAACVATAADGSLVVGSGTASAPTWTRSAVLLPRVPIAISCLRAGQANCLAALVGGGIARLVVPQGSVTPTTSVAGTGGLTGIRDLACPSPSLCIGVDDAGAVVRTNRPTGPASGWRRTVQPAVSAAAPEAQTGPTGLNSVSCPTVHFCAATGAQDMLLTTNTPASAALWRVTTLPFLLEESGGTFRENLGSIWCTSSTLCVSTGSSNRLFVSTQPAGGASTWKAFSLGAFNNDVWRDVACRNKTLCIAGDVVNGKLAVSTAPARSWSVFRLLGGGVRAAEITAVACAPNSGACLVGTGTGALWNSTTPARGPSSFRRITLSHRAIVGLACQSARLCVAIDQTGRVFSSTNPAGGAATWQAKALDLATWPSGGRLTAIACAPSVVCLAGDAGGRVYSGS